MPGKPSAVLHEGGEAASLSLLIQLLTYVLFTRLLRIFITILNLLKIDNKVNFLKMNTVSK